MRHIRFCSLWETDEWDPGVWQGEQVGGESKSPGRGETERGSGDAQRLCWRPGAWPPPPAADPHLEIPEPPQSWQVYCWQQSVAMLSRGAQLWP